jgi:hypothetical protein
LVGRPQGKKKRNHMALGLMGINIYLFVYLFTCDLFNDVLSRSDCIASKDAMISEY